MTQAIRIRHILLFVVLAAAFAMATSGKAWAFWSESGSGSGSAQVAMWEAPTNVQASASGTTVNISWNAASLQGNPSVVQRYDVVRSDGIAIICTTISLSCNNLGLTSGTYTYKVTAVFPTFTSQSSASNPVIIDTTAPVTIDNSASIGSAWMNGGVTVTLSPSDAESGVARTYYTTNGSLPTSSSAQGTSIVLSNEGIYTVKYFSVDNAGNAESVKTASVQIRIDKTSPSVVIAQPNKSVYRGASWPGVFSGTASDGLSGVASVSLTVQQVQSGKYWSGSAFSSATPVQLAATGTTNWSRSFSSTNFPADGDYVLAVNAVDAATNLSSAASMTFTIDNVTVKPTMPDLTAATDSGASNSDNITNSTSPTFVGVAEENATVAVFAGSTQVGSAVADEDGNYSVATTIATSSTYSITAKATDVAGNVSATSDVTSITIDRNAPTKAGQPDLTTATDSGSSTTDNVTNSATPTFTGTADSGTTVAIFAGSTQVGSASASAGAYTVMTAIDDDDDYAITAKSIDIAGNVSSTSDVRTVTIDRTAPSLTTLEMLDNDGDGKVDRVVASFSETLVSTSLNSQWALNNVPSGGSRGSVSTSNNQAIVLVNEGGGSASTTVGNFTVQLTANASGIRDSAGNLSSFAATKPADAAGPALLSVSSGGGTAGKMEKNDTLTLTFSEAVDIATVPSTVSVTEWRSGSGQGNAWLSIPGLLEGNISINRSYLAANNSSVQANAAVVLSNGNKTVTITLGNITSTGSGAGTATSDVTVSPDARLEDDYTNTAVGTATLSQLF